MFSRSAALTVSVFLTLSCASKPPVPQASRPTPENDPIAGAVVLRPCLTIVLDHYFDGIRELRGGAKFIVENGVLATSSPNEATCTTLDLRSKSVIPGLIDSHTHVMLTDKSYGTDFEKELERDAKRTNEERLAEARLHLRSLLRSGFTTIRDLGNSGRFNDVVLKQEKGSFPRLFVSGPGLAFGTGQFSPKAPKALVEKEYRILRKPEDAARFVAENATLGVDLVKVYADNDPQKELITPELLKAVIAAARRQSFRVTAHASFDSSARLAAEAGADSIEHGYELSKETLAIMKKKKIILVPTDYGIETCQQISKRDPRPDFHPCSNYRKNQSKRLLAARNLGVEIAFGSDAYLELESPLDDRGRQTVDSLLALIEEGLTPIQALRAATSSGAHVLGRNDLGVITPGARADLVAYAEDPIKNPKALMAPVLVIKDGVIVCGHDQEKCN
ncbi:MAG: amidohydrolase family protein [Bdellovibrionota bacterium]